MLNAFVIRLCIVYIQTKQSFAYSTETHRYNVRRRITSFIARTSTTATISKSVRLKCLDIFPRKTYITFYSKNSNICLSLRDPAGNRLTLVYPFGKMYRIELPQINETKFISRCMGAMRRILNRGQFLLLIITWYCTRNPPGSRDFSIAQEWEIFIDVLTDLMGCHAITREPSAMTSPSYNADEPKKRRKNDEITEGTTADWEYMLSVLNEDGSGCMNDRKKTKRKRVAAMVSHIDIKACLFSCIPSIFYGLHLLYEDFKLDETMHDCLPHMVKVSFVYMHIYMHIYMFLNVICLAKQFVYYTFDIVFASIRT